MSNAETATNNDELKFDIRDLDLWYGDFQALKNVNLQVYNKEVIACIGPSGCGKSTFLRNLNRMNDLIDICHWKGQITLDGEDIMGDMDVTELRTRVGMVFQKPNPFPMSIYDNVAYGPKMQGLRDKSRLAEIVESSLKKAALWDEVKDKLKQSGLALSGGQQQRLCIARAIAMEPEIILMDEPTSALDPIATQKIEELIEDLKKEFTIIIVTHAMHQAARVSDKTAFFLLGELLEFGETDQIFNNPQQQETADYIHGRFG